jgi:uncharacterized OB-fold protein
VLSGKGAVESWVVFHQNYFKGFADEIPYNVTLIRLAEGPQLVTNLVEIANADIHAGLGVEVVFHPATDDVTIPRFKPVGEV